MTVFAEPGSIVRYTPPEPVFKRHLYARFIVDDAQRTTWAIQNDRDVYAKWAVRARLRMLEALPHNEHLTHGLPGLGRAMLNRAIYGEPSRWVNQLNVRLRKRASLERRYVRRAVLSPFVKAMRSEMRGLISDLRDWRLVRPLTIRERLAAVWRAWKVRYPVESPRRPE